MGSDRARLNAVQTPYITVHTDPHESISGHLELIGPAEVWLDGHRSSCWGSYTEARTKKIRTGTTEKMGRQLVKMRAAY